MWHATTRFLGGATDGDSRGGGGGAGVAGAARHLPMSQHPTSADPQGAKRAMKAAFRARPPLLCGVCCLLAADYACFGYSASSCSEAASQ